MSYDLAVWYPNGLLSDQEALEQYYELCHGNFDRLKPLPFVEAFYQELSKIHPEIDDVPVERIGDFDFSPWSFENERSDRYVIMSCVWSHADYIYDLVLNLAKKHGLVMFDPQLTKIHYPKV
jgi:hypothetical protein